MKNSVITLFIIFYAFPLFAQEVVSSAGETNTIAGYEVSWTVGEPVIATVSGANNLLTQGFHQTRLNITSVEDFAEPIPGLYVYPNPASKSFIIRFSSEESKKEFSLYDLSGKIIQQNIIPGKETEVDIHSLANGSYLLHVRIIGTNQNQTFKIIKN